MILTLAEAKAYQGRWLLSQSESVWSVRNVGEERYKHFHTSVASGKLEKRTNPIAFEEAASDVTCANSRWKGSKR